MRVQTPRRWGEPFSAGVLALATLLSLPLRTNWAIVGIQSPYSMWGELAPPHAPQDQERSAAPFAGGGAVCCCRRGAYCCRWFNSTPPGVQHVLAVLGPVLSSRSGPRRSRPCTRAVW